MVVRTHLLKGIWRKKYFFLKKVYNIFANSKRFLYLCAFFVKMKHSEALDLPFVGLDKHIRIE